MASVATSFLTSLATVMYDKVVSDKPVRQDALRRPFSNVLNSRKSTEGIAKDKLGVMIVKESGATFQTWRDEATLNHDKQNTGILIDFPYMNGFMGLKLIHDEWKKKGYTIIPNDDGTPESRINDMTGDEYRRLKDLLGVEIRQFLDKWDSEFDKKMHRAAATSNDIDGLNGLMPINPYAGTFGNLSRSTNPLLRHPVVTGASTGAGGTMESTLESLWKDLNLYTHAKGIPGGVDTIVAGWSWIDGYRTWARNNGVQINLDPKGTGKLDIGIRAFSWKGIDIIHDPMLDLLDQIAASEQGIPYASGITVPLGTVPGGSGGAAVAYVTSGGAVSGYAITNPGSGYTAGVNAVAATGGGGTGATFNVFVYGISGTNVDVVDADDERIGQISRIVVNAAGSGFTVPSTVTFTKRAYLLNSKTWDLKAQPKLDKKVSMPRDPINQRISYIQVDGTYFLTMNAPRANGIHCIA